MADDKSPHQSRLRKGRFSESGRAYAITKCTSSGLCFTDDPRVASALIEVLFWMDDRDRFSLGAFVVMPDHYHMVIIPNENMSLAQLMRSLGAYTARKANRIRGSDGQFWQKGYYDRAIRKTEDISAIFDYIHNNPVRRGMVECAERWPHSSLAPGYYERIRWHIFM